MHDLSQHAFSPSFVNVHAWHSGVFWHKRQHSAKEDKPQNGLEGKSFPNKSTFAMYVHCCCCEQVMLRAIATPIRRIERWSIFVDIVFKLWVIRIWLMMILNTTMHFHTFYTLLWSQNYATCLMRIYFRINKWQLVGIQNTLILMKKRTYNFI